MFHIRENVRQHARSSNILQKRGKLAASRIKDPSHATRGSDCSGFGLVRESCRVHYFPR
ncbi:unnamed protein product [Periconia digitata]|uniref:Uncharacterized protein n=1 Tax=Periconia digitata TaxID=1303443 RepID=A0A9W4UF17_9PLEO|nr:unnamed protein product [Periconia digitata]